MNAQNQVFSASVSLVSIQSLSIFADYQMLAAMGHLLAYLKEPHSIDAEPLTLPFGFVPLRIAPIRILDPDARSQPLPVKGTIVEPSLAPSEHPTPVSPKVKFGRASRRVGASPLLDAAQLVLDDRPGLYADDRCEGDGDRGGGPRGRAHGLRGPHQPTVMAAEADRRSVNPTAATQCARTFPA